MAQLTPESVNLKWCVKDSQGNPLVGVFEVLEGTSTSYPVWFMDVRGTTYYYWPNSSGVMRYGTTAPTTAATQDTAGAAV